MLQAALCRDVPSKLTGTKFSGYNDVGSVAQTAPPIDSTLAMLAIDSLWAQINLRPPVSGCAITDAANHALKGKVNSSLLHTMMHIL